MGVFLAVLGIGHVEGTEVVGAKVQPEEMARIDVGDVLIGVVLEELLAGSGSAQATKNSKLAVVDVRDACAVVLTLGLRI